MSTPGVAGTGLPNARAAPRVRRTGIYHWAGVSFVYFAPALRFAALPRPSEASPKPCSGHTWPYRAGAFAYNLTITRSGMDIPVLSPDRALFTRPTYSG